MTTFQENHFRERVRARACARKLILLLLLLSSCSIRKQPVMSLSGFQAANVGISEEYLVQMYGPPTKIRCLDGGMTVYEYEERFQEGISRRTLLQVRRYYFYVRNGQVVSKQMRLYDRPGYEFEPGGELHWE